MPLLLPCTKRRRPWNKRYRFTCPPYLARWLAGNVGTRRRSIGDRSAWHDKGGQARARTRTAQRTCKQEERWSPQPIYFSVCAYAQLTTACKRLNLIVGVESSGPEGERIDCAKRMRDIRDAMQVGESAVVTACITQLSASNHKSEILNPARQPSSPGSG